MPHRNHLDQLFQAIDEGYCLAEMIRDDQGRPQDYRFVETNPLFEAMTGMTDTRGRTAREMRPGVDQSWLESCDAVARGQTQRFQQRSEATGRVFDVFATPVLPEGRFALVMRDITERQRIEAEREDARARAENLLAELNHRVMNTLAMITALVRMESHELGDKGAGQALQRLETRLAAVTTLYRALHRAADVTQVAADRYLPEVAQAVAGSLSQDGRVAVVCDCAAESLPTDSAAPLGLFLNEVMTNALKYAFPDGRSGTLRVGFRRIDAGHVALSVADDGIGTDAAQATAHTHGTGGTGTRLIEAFAEQLQGRLDIDSSDKGTAVTITFPLARAGDAPAQGQDEDAGEGKGKGKGEGATG